MLSARLVHLIEAHGEQIVDRATAQIRKEPTTRAQALLEYELRDLGQWLTVHLGASLSGSGWDRLEERCERLGQLCTAQKIALDAALRGLFLLREKMLDFAQEHLLSNSSIELYAEEELDRRMGRFFDRLAIHVAHGFEKALREPEAVRTAIH